MSNNTTPWTEDQLAQQKELRTLVDSIKDLDPSLNTTRLSKEVYPSHDGSYLNSAINRPLKRITFNQFKTDLENYYDKMHDYSWVTPDTVVDLVDYLLNSIPHLTRAKLATDVNVTSSAYSEWSLTHCKHSLLISYYKKLLAWVDEQKQEPVEAIQKASQDVSTVPSVNTNEVAQNVRHVLILTVDGTDYYLQSTNEKEVVFSTNLNSTMVDPTQDVNVSFARVVEEVKVQLKLI